jgi:hypothetical protein
MSYSSYLSYTASNYVKNEPATSFEISLEAFRNGHEAPITRDSLNDGSRFAFASPACLRQRWDDACHKEPHIIDVTNYDEIVQAIDDGGLDRIIDEHLRYMKETDRESWAL